MSRRKKERGRPLERLYPPRIDATSEQLVQAMFNTPPDAVFESREYRCSECGREVNYPETLYADNQCSDCHPVEGSAKLQANLRGGRSR